MVLATDLRQDAAERLLDTRFGRCHVLFACKPDRISQSHHGGQFDIIRSLLMFLEVDRS